MPVEIVVPQVGEAVSEVKLVKWLKQEGDHVRQGEPLFEVDTDKAVVEVEAFAEGTLDQILIRAGTAVMPRQVVGYLKPVGQAESYDGLDVPVDLVKRSPLGTSVSKQTAVASHVSLNEVKGIVEPSHEEVHDARGLTEQPATRDPTPMRPATRAAMVASPKARRLAKERGVGLEGVKGTGMHGLITEADVNALTQSQAAPKAHLQPFSRMRQAVALRMQASKQQIPHFYLIVDVDMTEAQRLRDFCAGTPKWKRPPSYTDLVVCSCALSLSAMPSVNISYTPNGIAVRQSIDIGIAVSLEEGLIVPVLAHADELSLAQVSEGMEALADRARRGRLRDSDLTEKSMVVSNLGMYGVDAFIAIIDSPDPMILAVGKVTDRVVALQGQPVVRPTCTLTLSIDHRVLDGAKGAEFLIHTKDFLEKAFDLWGLQE